MTQEMEGCGKAELSPDLNSFVLMCKTVAGRSSLQIAKDLKKYIWMQVSVYGNENWVNVIKKMVHT